MGLIKGILTNLIFFSIAVLMVVIIEIILEGERMKKVLKFN